MKVLVTGGSGFIGSYVTERLVKDGHQVLVFDHTPSKGYILPKSDGFVSHFWGDIKSKTDVFEAVAHVDAFIHLAGVLGTQETIEFPIPAVETNIFGGLNVLEAASLYKVPGVNIAVGNHWESNTYSISKSTMERFVDMYNRYRGTQISIVRALNAYGPRQSVAAPYGPSKVRKIMPSFIHKALNNEKIEIYGNGSQIMDMVYVSDVADVLVDALYKTLDSPFFYSSGVFEAGTGVETTVNDIAMAVIKEVHDVDLGLVNYNDYLSYLPMRPGETATKPVLASVSTLKPIYGAYPKGFVSLTEGVKRTVEYYRSVSS